MRVLVTGGAGYIGSHVARELRRRGHTAVIYDNLSRGRADFARGFELIRADIRDRSALDAALRGVDAVMHFAALIEVGESERDPQRYFDNNTVAALDLLKATHEAGIRIFVFSSTAAVYGIPQAVPIPESAPREPVNAYGASKLCVELALEAFGRAYGLRYAALRYFNAAGADESGEIGEAHVPETHLIPRVLDAVAGQCDELQIYGDDYPTPDGTCIRDYIHVTDLAEAHVMAIDHLASGGESAAFNLGTGDGHSVKQVISTVESVTGRTLKKRVMPRRAGDSPVLVADPSLAQRVIGWKPTRSLLQMVESAWRWHKLLVGGSGR